MSLSLARSLSVPFRRIISQSRNLKIHSRGFQSNVQQTFGGIKFTQRGCTRSLWHMCRTTNNHLSVNSFARSCVCRGMHTDGDKELTQFLDSEIKYEEENETSRGTLPEVNGFSVSKAEGSEVTLTRDIDGEKVTVRFNVNHSVDDAGPQLGEEEGMTEGEEQKMPSMAMESKPQFEVCITKGDETLHIQCSYPPPYGEDMEKDEEGLGYEDAIEITELAMTKAGEEWEEKQYLVSGTNMDENMYEMILGMLEERGVDGDFAEQLVKFSTSYEQKQYIAFLKRLQSFTSK